MRISKEVETRIGEQVTITRVEVEDEKISASNSIDADTLNRLVDWLADKGSEGRDK